MASQDSSAFEYLLSIDRQCVEQQGGLAQQEADTSYSHGLAFNVGPHRYIISITEIDEVIAISNYTSIPHTPNWLIGIANVRGNLVTLLDLHAYIFGSASKVPARSKRALLIKMDAHFYGLVIDSMVGMKSFHSDNGNDQVPEDFDPNYIEYISAFYSSGEEWYAALSVENLLLDERFQRIANNS